ncbi:two-component system response regulator CiaR [Enterococcus sp. PF1-24]|uniref:response regulator transcription factor n=1 Tax=unclassified Enterococcus TaxID=2608891 RepID=UPI002476A3E3|nr:MULTISPECIES: response regulator transcription factor [unclassified Enterococcus]MDH6363317.1 two-component system response regulator CiaR [Enterococcus sp. PFB1-1]MDH6400382.1 two-component system response regulator CiaR [Enterococcus sp. PF1-24]
MYSFLVIEDEEQLAISIGETLKSLGKSQLFHDGLEGQIAAETGKYDLIVLDIMLPGKNGLDILWALREMAITTPVLLLTARGELSDKVAGFKKGADDYLVKPFHREELLMRVKAILKRSQGFKEEEVLYFEGLTCHLSRYEISYQDKTLALQGKLFELLTYLLRNQRIIVTKEQIFERIWGYDSETAISVVEVYISNLRKELKKIGITDWIRTIRNVGYLLERKD